MFVVMQATMRVDKNWLPVFDGFPRAVFKTMKEAEEYVDEYLQMIEKLRSENTHIEYEKIYICEVPDNPKPLTWEVNMYELENDDTLARVYVTGPDIDEYHYAPDVLPKIKKESE